jgi:PAS domain S-box-containing protein
MSNKEELTAGELQFEHLPAFAEFLLKNKVREFSKVQLDLMFDVNLPILKKYDLSIYTKEQLIDLSLPSYTDFLTAAIENRLSQFIDKSIKTWETNQLPEITRDQLVVEDIILATYVRKSGLSKFIPAFTMDVEKAMNLVKEIDDYSLLANSKAFHAYIRIHHEQIDEINKTLRAHESELLSAQEIAGLGSFEWDLTGGGKSKYTPQVYRIFEMEKTSTLPEFMEFVHPADREKLRKTLHEAIHEGKEYQCEYRYNRNGKEKVLWSKGVVTFEDSKPVNMKGTVMDITDRYFILKRLERNEELYKQAQKLTHIGNWTVDLATGKIEFSEELRRIYGIEAGEEVTFELLLTIVHPEDKEIVLKKLDDSIKNREGHELDFRIIRRQEGDTRFIRRIAEVHTDEENKPYKVVGTGQDITKEVSLAKELREREAALEELNLSLEQKNIALERTNKELTSFSYVASHDLQEPIRKIRTFSNLILEKEPDLSEEGKDCFNRIITSAGRMQKLIDDLLSFSRTQVYENVQMAVDLNQVFSEINSFYRESIIEGRVAISYDRLPVIHAIPFQIQQLMENIIGNSIKYSRPDKKTEVRIHSEQVDAKQLPWFSLKENNRKYYRISIADNGIGFDQKYSEKIFEIFQRLHGKSEYSGTGIGLSICKKIVENHRGHISARGVQDEGAVFEIYFPS